MHNFFLTSRTLCDIGLLVFPLISLVLSYKFSNKVGFVSVFNWLVLETQTELDEKLGHYEYLLLVKRSFLGSLVS